MTSSHKQPEPDQPPMASHTDLDEYVMPDIQHSDESDGTYSITMTPVSGSEYGGGDDEKEPLKPKESPNEVSPGMSLAGIVGSILCSVFLMFSVLGVIVFVDFLFSGPAAPGTSSSSSTNKTESPRCGPTKPFEGYHLLPAYNQTPYGILDCNLEATHAELLQSFLNKSTAATLVHFYNGRPDMPEEMDCRPWKRPVHEDSQALRDPEGSGLNKLTPEEWAIRWFFLEEDRPVADAEILPRLGFYREQVWCYNDEASRGRRLDQYIAQMEVVRQEVVRKTQLEINKELEDKKKKWEEKTRMKSETSHSDEVIEILSVLDKLGIRVKPEDMEQLRYLRETEDGKVIV